MSNIYIVTINENCYEKILSKIGVKQKVIFGSEGPKTFCYNFLAQNAPKFWIIWTNFWIQITCFCVEEGFHRCRTEGANCKTF